jgi:hypothetical protein
MSQRVVFLALALCFGIVLAPGLSRGALISMYEFNGSTADSVRGASGAGTFVGTTSYVPGRIGDGLVFNGSSYLTAPVVGGGLSAFSISAWVKVNTTTTWATIVKNWGESSQGAFHLGLDNASSKFSEYITSTSPTTMVMDSATITTGQWIHVATTFNGAAGRHKIYVNGVNKATSAAAGSLVAFGSKMSMGAKLNDSQNGPAVINTGYLNGVLDDVGFYDEELSSTQISTIYNNGLSGVGAVPEPSSVSLLVIGLGGLAALRRLKRD